MASGYWWDSRTGRLSRKRMGCKAFCYEIDLLTVNHHEQGRDVLERKFFGDVDTRGARVRDRLLTDNPQSLDLDERCDFARLLLSLEARRPAIVRRLRDSGARYLSDVIDGDSELQLEMAREGLAGTPSELAAEHGISLQDEALSGIQLLVDNPTISARLINMPWRVVRLGPCDGTLVLSDRPLIRLHGIEHPNAAWFLPLNSQTAFCAVNDPREFDKATPQRFAKQLNVASAGQAEKFVFCKDNTHTRWLPKYLAT